MKDDNTIHSGYNKTNSKSRIRFTIAHEIGHYILHAKDSKLFVDKETKIFRNSNSSTGEIVKEREANAFAAAILMPHKLIVSEIDKIKNNGKDNFISTLAKKLKVSEQAITIRLTNLGLLDYFDIDF